MVTLKSFLGMIAAVPFIMACNQTGQVNATLFPASGSENVNPDTHLVLTFSETPVLGDSGMIRVYDAVTDQVVDSLDLSIPSGPTESRTYGPELIIQKCLMTILVPLCLPIKILVRVLLRERRNLLLLCTSLLL